MVTERDPDIASYDDPELYEASFGLRQRDDAQWVLEKLPLRGFRSALDVGCGSGNFLAQLIGTGRVASKVVGIDRSPEMVGAARRKLQPWSDRLEVSLLQADALAAPPIQGPFDLVSMMAVLHWLYPLEAKVFSWISGLLADHGTFCVTTYHPAVDHRSCGGSDIVVLEAMKRIGSPSEFPDDFIPMGRRTRTPEGIHSMLRASFRVQDVFTRPAILRVADAGQFADYHVATFGSYYSRLLPPDRRPRFLDALGEVAVESMTTRGYVTSMDVRLWFCSSHAVPG